MLRLKPTQCRSWVTASVPRSIVCLIAAGILLAGNTPAQARKQANPNIKAQAANLVNQWRAGFQSELAFVRHICPNLPPDLRVSVKAAAEQALLAAADEVPGNQDLSNYKGPTPQSMIRAAVFAELCESLPADQWAHFAAEAEARVKRRQTAAIELLVEHVDQALYLKQEQRDQIRTALADHWQPAWEGWLQLRFMQGTPTLPNDMVMPYLDAEQKARWQAIGKQGLSPYYLMGQIQQNGRAVDTDWWDEALPKTKPAAADVPAP
jgi:hypothetical protein